MKKLICIALVVVSLVCCLSGCDMDSVVTPTEIPESQVQTFKTFDEFEILQCGLEGCKILRHKLTDVLYLQLKDSGGYSGYGGLTVLLNSDGTPLLYEEWLALKLDAIASAEEYE